MSKSSHSFSVDIAAQEGLIEAILLQHIHILQTSFLERDQQADNVWVRRSVRAYHITYPYLTDKKISGALDRMEERDLIRSKIENKVAYDRTKSVQLARKGWAYFRENAFDEKENGKDQKENGFDQTGESLQGSYSSFVDSFVEGERTPPAPNPSTSKEEKKENGLVAPGREKSTADIIFETAAEYGIEAEIPPSKKVAPKKDSPKICVTCAGVGSTHGWDGPEICEDCGGNGNESAQFDVTAIASPTRLPGVTLVEAAPKPIQPWERPLPGSPKELKNVLLRYSEENPENWRDNVLGSGRATGMTKEKIDEYLTDFCQWQFQQDSTKGRLSQYTAGFSLWLKRQPRFEVMNAPKEGSQTRNSQQTPPPNYQTQTRH